MSRLCIYHGNCADGFGAAWAVRKYHLDNDLPLPEFHPGFYQSPPPDVTGKDVFIVDFSYKRPVLLEMAAKAKSIIIIDHHQTAKADLDNISSEAPNVITHFDMEHSGARLTWDYFFGNVKPPRLIDVIEDRDLWRFKLGQDFTREVQAALFSFPYDFDTWTGLMMMDIHHLRRDGAAIERKHFKDIHELIAANMQWWEISGYKVPVLNVPYMWSSDAGHIMWKETDSKFAVCYWNTKDGRVFSLRSRPEFDCSEIAKQYGGGGHKNAAGFKVPFDHPLARREQDATRGSDIPADLQQSTGGK